MSTDDFKNPMDQRLADLQVDAIVKYNRAWIGKHVLRWLQVFAWLFAIGACALPVGLFAWVAKPIKPYAVTTSGFVAELDPIVSDRVEWLESVVKWHKKNQNP